MGACVGAAAIGCGGGSGAGGGAEVLTSIVPIWIRGDADSAGRGVAADGSVSGSSARCEAVGDETVGAGGDDGADCAASASKIGGTDGAVGPSGAGARSSGAARVYVADGAPGSGGGEILGDGVESGCIAASRARGATVARDTAGRARRTIGNAPASGSAGVAATASSGARSGIGAASGGVAAFALDAVAGAAVRCTIGVLLRVDFGALAATAFAVDRASAGSACGVANRTGMPDVSGAATRRRYERRVIFYAARNGARRARSA